MTKEFNDLLFGSAAGFTGKLVEYPFVPHLRPFKVDLPFFQDTIKVRLQSQPIRTAASLQATTPFNGTFDCLWKTLKTEGVFGLYKVTPLETISVQAQFTRESRFRSLVPS